MAILAGAGARPGNSLGCPPRDLAQTAGVPASDNGDLASPAEAIRLDILVLVSGLRAVLGAKLVAHLGGVRDTRTVRQWADGVRGVQDPTHERRLRLAYQVAALLGVREPEGVVAAWFEGLNPELGDRAPARVLREDDLHRRPARAGRGAVVRRDRLKLAATESRLR